MDNFYNQLDIEVIQISWETSKTIPNNHCPDISSNYLQPDFLMSWFSMVDDDCVALKLKDLQINYFLGLLLS